MKHQVGEGYELQKNRAGAAGFFNRPPQKIAKNDENLSKNSEI